MDETSPEACARERHRPQRRRSESFRRVWIIPRVASEDNFLSLHFRGPARCGTIVSLFLEVSQRPDLQTDRLSEIRTVIGIIYRDRIEFWAIIPGEVPVPIFLAHSALFYYLLDAFTPGQPLAPAPVRPCNYNFIKLMNLQSSLQNIIWEGSTHASAPGNPDLKSIVLNPDLVPTTFNEWIQSHRRNPGKYRTILLHIIK